MLLNLIEWVNNCECLHWKLPKDGLPGLGQVHVRVPLGLAAYSINVLVPKVGKNTHRRKSFGSP